MTVTLSKVDRGRAQDARPRPPRRHRLSTVDAKVSPYLFVAPFFVLFTAIGLFPLLYTAYVSLFDWEVGADDPAFIGLENYRTLFEDGQFWNALFNTFSIFLLSSAPQIVIAVVIAALLNANLRARTGWRMGVLLPYVASLVALTIIFGNLFGPQYGLVNDVLTTVGLDPIDWQASTFGSHVAIASMVNWRWTGYNALIVLAAMQAIPREVHEAAMVDGASALRRFFSITLPMLKPTLIFVIVTSTIGGLQIFTEPKLFEPSGGSGGGTEHQYQTVVLYLYQSAFQGLDLGYASAIAWVLFLIVIAVAGLNFFITRRAVR
ncbi:carbohydrate ABC transporter permease [Lentzea sp. E54]|uniref:carbohydrate ABC transporter permease n=1 Tax=Lentzea xerophila TaxID=3435883 RepID=UPI003DA38156